MTIVFGYCKLCDLSIGSDRPGQVQQKADQHFNATGHRIKLTKAYN